MAAPPVVAVPFTFPWRTGAAVKILYLSDLYVGRLVWGRWSRFGLRLLLDHISDASKESDGNGWVVRD